MRLLIAGGSSFVGRAITWSAILAGHDVTIINRGVTPVDLPDSVTRLVGDRHGDLSALNGVSFDATIDTIAYRPSDVRALAAALAGRGGHHVQISSISAYEEPSTAGATENTTRTYPVGSVDEDVAITGDTYGPLKAACEYEAARQFGDALSIVRPTYVIGAHDKTLRFPYWVARIARGGRVAVPTPTSVALQWIDARDLADFTVSVAQRRLSGAWHTASAPLAFGEVLSEIVRVVNPSAELVEVDATRVPEGTFPLWAGPEGSPILEMDSSAALAEGLVVRELSDSIRDTQTWVQAQPWAPHWLSESDEAALLA